MSWAGIAKLTICREEKIEKSHQTTSNLYSTTYILSQQQQSKFYIENLYQYILIFSSW